MDHLPEDFLMQLIRVFGVLLATITLTACLNSTTIVKVKPDGSGTVEQTTLVNTSALKGMMAGGDKPAGAPVIDREDLERTAQSMGRGVRLVSAEKATGAPGYEGTRAIFAFDDINLIQISQHPDLNAGGSGRLSTEPTGDDPVKFKLIRGAGTSTLTINYLDKPPAGSVQPNAAGGDMPDFTNPMIMNMMKTMFQGFKINIGLEVVGSIVKTNADYVSGSHITLLEMDVTELLSDEAQLKTLQSKISAAGPASLSLSQVKPLLRDLKGIKIDGPSISVEFR
jgi:hypothetical protein